MHRSLLLLTAVLAAAGCARVPGLPSAPVTSGVATKAARGEIVVKFKDAAPRQGLLQKLGARTVKAIAPLGAVVLQAPDPAAALAELAADPAVAYAEANRAVRLVEPKDDVDGVDAPVFGVDDPLAKKQWALGKLQAPQAWALTRGKRQVKVSIIDTGVDYAHPDLAGRVIKGRDFVQNDDDPMDQHSHGTHCAGIAAASANNGVGVAGLAPEVSVLAVRVLAENGVGYNDDIAAAIVYSADQGAQVLSLSLGDHEDSQLVVDAIAYARKQGALVIAAMGNDSSWDNFYPAATPGVMAVGATNKHDWRSMFSNLGKHMSVSAPGSGIMSAVPHAKYGSKSGTSMAAPYVAGLAALVWSKHPGFTAEQVRAKIEATADDISTKGFDPRTGHGRINAFRALKE